MNESVRLPEWAAVWVVRVSPELADDLRRRVGSDRRAALEEVPQRDAPPADALAFRVDGELVVLVEATWPRPNYGQRHRRAFAMLREVEPAPPRNDDRDPRLEPTTLGEARWFLREAGLDLDLPNGGDVEHPTDGQLDDARWPPW